MRAAKILYGGEDCFVKYNPLVSKLAKEDVSDVPLEEYISLQTHVSTCEGCRGRYIKLKEAV